MPWPPAGLGCPRPLGSPPGHECFTRFSPDSKAARWAGGREAPGVQRTVLGPGPGRGGSIPGSLSQRAPAGGSGGAGEAGPMAARHLRDGRRSRPRGQRSLALRKTAAPRACGRRRRRVFGKHSREALGRALRDRAFRAGTTLTKTGGGGPAAGTDVRARGSCRLHARGSGGAEPASRRPPGTPAGRALR